MQCSAVQCSMCSAVQYSAVQYSVVSGKGYGIIRSEEKQCNTNKVDNCISPKNDQNKTLN